MKRVLHLVHRMSPGGVESLIMNLYRNIDKTKYQFDFYVFSRGDYDKEIIKMGGKIYYADSFKKCGILKFLKKWDLFLQDHKEYDTIHCHLNNIGILMLKIAKNNNIKNIIIHSHASESLGGVLPKIFRKILNKMAINNSTMMLGCSDKANEWLYGGKSKDAIIIPNGIDAEKYKYNKRTRNKIRKELNIPEKTIVIGHIGRLVKVKNHEYLIEIFDEYQRRNKNSLLILIGDGSQKEKIKRLIQEKKLDDKVLMLGTKTNVNDYMCAFDIFIFPSFSEGLPVTLIEAQASGLIVLASNNISKMCKILDSYKELSIEEPAVIWSSYIKKSNNRSSAYKDVNESLFNIQKVAKKYESILDTNDCYTRNLTGAKYNISTMNRQNNMRNDEVISVVVPIYNIKDYISKCIDSIIKQTYNNLEIILIDDGSKDGSSEICDKYKEMDERIIVIHKKNGGLSDARNKGIDVAKGKYIFFIDGDDYMSNDCIYDLHQNIIKYSADIATTQFQSYNSADILDELKPTKGASIAMNTENALEDMLYQKMCTNSAWGKLYKKQLFDNIRYPKGKICEDLATTYKVFSKANTIVFGKSKDYFYTQRDDSITKTNFNLERAESLKFAKEETSFIAAHYPRIIKAAKNREFMEGMYIILAIKNDKNYSGIKKEAIDVIKKTRATVLLDIKSGARAKAFAFASLFGINNMLAIINMLNTIKNRSSK